MSIHVAGQRLAATQYADDTEPLLNDEAAVAPCVSHMSQYKAASWKGMQARASQLLGRDTHSNEPPVAELEVLPTPKAWALCLAAVEAVVR